MDTSPLDGHKPEPREGSGLLALAIKRPVGVTMVLIALLVFGIVGFSRLSVTLLPDLSYPTITIRTEYEGASPEDVEDRISEPIREAVSVLSKVVRVTSISRSGQSDVVVEFTWGTEMVYAVGDIREKLERVFLPRSVDRPLILRYDPSLDPMLTIGLSGRMPAMQLRDLAEDELERELAEIDGVAAVKVKGGDEKEILISIDPVKLTALGLDIRQIAQKIGAENLNASAGILEEGQTEYLVRALNEFRDLDEVRDLIVARRGTTNIYLREVAKVTRAVKEKDVITRIDGAPAVLIEIFKEDQANLVALSRTVNERIFGTEAQLAYVNKLRLARAKAAAGASSSKERSEKQAEASKPNAAPPKKGKGSWDQKRKRRMAQMHHAQMTDYIAYGLPKDVKLRVLSNPSTYIEGSIDEVKSSGILGGLFAILVIFLFLRSGKPTLLISLAIPTSLLITFAPLHLAGVTLNVMSLGGLALGVGMLVDTSIVVLESIARCREEGDDMVTAALRGVSQVHAAVIASTLTTVAVFLPIVFVEGIAGQLFRDQALAVVFSLLASLGVSLFFIPMLASRGRLDGADTRVEDRGPARGRIDRLFRKLGDLQRATLTLVLRVFLLCIYGAARFIGMLLYPLVLIFRACYEPIERGYPSVLRASLRMRGLILLIALGLAAFAGLRFGHLGSEVVPEVHEGQFEALVFFARDIDVETTDKLASPMEKRIAEMPEVAATFLTCGLAKDELKSSEEGPSSARIHIRLRKGAEDLEAQEERVRARIRGFLDEEPAVHGYRFQNPTIFSIRTPISVELLGHDLSKLMRASKLVQSTMEELPSLRDIRSTMNRGNTEVVVHFDREKLSQAGLEIGEASRRLSAMVKGEVPTRFAEREKKIDMRVRVDPENLASIRQLGALNLAITGTTPILLSSVAALQFLEGPSEIRRLGNERGAEIQATVRGLDLGSVQEELLAALDGVELPEGITLRLGGQKEEMDRSQSSMIGALLLAIFLVYVVMAAQFESLLQPLIILFTVPLALIGVVLSLDVLDIPLSVVVFIGVIMLAGIVVNNAIVLLDRINQERQRGKRVLEAVIDGASIRLRPVLMTTMTTVLGLLPLTGWLGGLVPFSTGEGVELRSPMAVAVITGLSFSTVLTLLVIPVIYSLVIRDRADSNPALERQGS